MRSAGWLAAMLLACGSPVTAGVAVRESQGRVEVTATAASLADVLEQVARQTGMKVVYEGPPPRQLVTLALVGRSPAEAVVGILEGQGLNYALVLDATAQRVEKLLVTGSGAGRSIATARYPVEPPARAPRLPAFAEPAPEPESDSEPEEDEEDEVVPEGVTVEGTGKAPEGAKPGPQAPPNPFALPAPGPTPTPTPAPPGLVPFPTYPSSPFNPKPAPPLPVPAPQPTPVSTPPPPS